MTGGGASADPCGPRPLVLRLSKDEQRLVCVLAVRQSLS